MIARLEHVKMAQTDTRGKFGTHITAVYLNSSKQTRYLYKEWYWETHQKQNVRKLTQSVDGHLSVSSIRTGWTNLDVLDLQWSTGTETQPKHEFLVNPRPQRKFVSVVISLLLLPLVVHGQSNSADLSSYTGGNDDTTTATLADIGGSVGKLTRSPTPMAGDYR